MRIEWKSRAVKELDRAFCFTFERFGKRVAILFYREIRKYDTYLLKNPCLGMVEPLLEGRNKVYRSLVVHRYFKLVYYIDDVNDVINIVDIWDVRREPKGLSQSVK